MAGPRISSGWPLTKVNAEQMDGQSRPFGDEKEKQTDVELNEGSSVHSGSDASQVVGSADLFDENGNIRLIPVRWLTKLKTVLGTSLLTDEVVSRCQHQIQRASDKIWSGQEHHCGNPSLMEYPHRSVEHAHLEKMGRHWRSLLL